MRLQEEYIKRNKIQYKPIYHTKNTNIILKNNIIINIKLEEIIGRPANYIISQLKPNHKSYLDGKYFLKFKENTCQYEEYFDFIKKLAQTIKVEPIQFAQIEFAIWGIFLYCFDGWLDKTLQRCVENKEIHLFFDHLKTNHPLAWRAYNDEFKKYESNYAGWLVDLIGFSGV